MTHKDLQPRNSDTRRILAFIPLFMAHQFNPPQFYPPQSQSQQQPPQQQQQQRKPLPLSQQQQFPAYDARMMMMMPPPPPQQRPPSTRPGTAGRQQQPSLSQQQQQQPSAPSLFQQQHSPGRGFPSQGSFDPQYQQQQQQQQQLHQQQQAGHNPQFAGISSSIHHQQHPPQQQQFHPQIQPHPDGRLALHPQSQLQMQMQMQLAGQTQAQAQLHQQQHTQSHQIHPGQPAMPGTPTPMQTSPSLRKRKLPHSPSPAPSQHNHHTLLPPTQPAAVPGLSPSRMPPPIDVKPPPPSSAAVVSGQSHSQTPHLSLNPAITHISSVPLVGSGPAITPLTPDDMTNMKIWIDRDKAYEQALNASRERSHRELNEALRAKIGWWEEEIKPRHKMGRERFGILWPDRKRKERSDKLRRAGIRSQNLKFPSRLRSDISDKKEDLIPIRLELDVEHHKLRETFVWNVNDPLVKPESLAQSIVDDFKLASHYVQTIAKAIHEQLQEHAPEPEETTNVHSGVLDSTTEAWWGAWRKRIRTQRGFVRTRWQSEDDADDESSNSDRKVIKGRKKRRKLGVDVPEVMGETPMSLEELRPKEPVSGLDMDEEWRILIKIHVLVGSMKLEDQFEWDLACTTNSPEQFAIQYTAELGLPGEFTTAIAHQIREQVYVYRKAILSGLAGQPVEDDELRPTFLPPLTRSTIARTLDNANAHMPLLNYLSDGEIERNEREREKEIKRRRRTVRSKTAGGGLHQFTTGGRIMPDRTYRTPGIGFPEVDNTALSGQGSQGSVGATTTTSRRAAAAAASLTIANMVASENGGSPIQMNMPDPLPIRPVRETPKKGLMPPPQHPSQPPQKMFKAPALPPTVYRPRAKLALPPPSTSLDPSKYRRRLGSTKGGVDTNMDDDDDGASLLPPPPPPPLPPARLTAKQLRDLEKEAKEREYAEGQHENVINGVWHCSNCGCPDNIAIGRRKGPLGDKSQCGPCGKFYHRHRRPRPVEYRIDPEYHLKLRNESEKGKGGVGKRKGVGRPSAAATEAMRKKKEEEKEDEDEKDDEKEKETEKDDEKDEKEKEEDKELDDDDDDGKEGTLKPVSMISNASVGKNNDLGAVHVGPASPTDSSSSEEPPLALKNTGEKPRSPALPPPPPQASLSSSPVIPRHSPVSPAMKTTVKVPVQRPEWLRRALDEMQARYPEDRFDVVLRKSTDPNAPPEWRVKCHDCPGKLYTPGPEETLANFDVHLKNRKHRAQVNARINNTTPPPQ
ncbi:hypothetical protein Clacol_010381 [Clathrus columnatus]|uniref:SNF5-domain-containing protein n=1 Tax=Clathrus columnatus TaxID=1419009 RepID=A0AAV5AQK6_9AGAM|nr:hypothetical protein Clacol_010381 [Clathrus columnatus]